MSRLAIDDERLRVAVEAAEAGAKVARSRPPGEYQLKEAPSDIVTEADRQAEHRIRERILSHDSDHRIRGEEHGTRHGNTDTTWIVDPIDGTTNYQHRVPPSCTMVAAVTDEGLHAGAIVTHHTDDLYYAVRNEGAYKNHTRINASDRSSIDRALFHVEVTERMVERDDETTKELLWELTGQCRGIRKYRCAGYALALVAEGRLDATIERYVNPWDLAPGMLLAEEAGARVTDYDGNAGWDTLSERPVNWIATNGEIHEEVLKMASRAT